MLTALAGLQADRALGAASEEYGLDTPPLRFWVTANGSPMPLRWEMRTV